MWLVHCCFANFLWWLFSLGSCYLCWSLWFWKFLMLIVVVRVVVLSVLDTVGCCLLATSICVWGLHLSSPLWLFFLALVLCWLLSFLCWLFWHSTICVRGLHLPSPLCASGRQPGQHSQKEQSTFQPEVFLYLSISTVFVFVFLSVFVSVPRAVKLANSHKKCSIGCSRPSTNRNFLHLRFVNCSVPIVRKWTDMWE